MTQQHPAPFEDFSAELLAIAAELEAQ